MNERVNAIPGRVARGLDHAIWRAGRPSAGLVEITKGSRPAGFHFGIIHENARSLRPTAGKTLTNARFHFYNRESKSKGALLWVSYALFYVAFSLSWELFHKDRPCCRSGKESGEQKLTRRNFRGQKTFTIIAVPFALQRRYT